MSTVVIVAAGLFMGIIALALVVTIAIITVAKLESMQDDDEA